MNLTFVGAAGVQAKSIPKGLGDKFTLKVPCSRSGDLL